MEEFLNDINSHEILSLWMVVNVIWCSKRLMNFAIMCLIEIRWFAIFLKSILFSIFGYRPCFISTFLLDMLSYNNSECSLILICFFMTFFGFVNITVCASFVLLFFFCFQVEWFIDFFLYIHMLFIQFFFFFNFCFDDVIYKYKVNLFEEKKYFVFKLKNFKRKKYLPKSIQSIFVGF